MFRKSTSFADLPVELTTKTLFFLLPDNVRALRYVIVACHNTDHEILCTIAQHVLNSQRKWLLDRWDPIFRETQAVSKTNLEQASSLQSIAKQIIGKQYVEDTELINKADDWVSLCTSFTYIRDLSQKPIAYTCDYQAFKKADFDVEKIRILRRAHCYPDLQMENPMDYDIDSPYTYRRSKCNSQPQNKARLNIEVGFLPHPCPGNRAKLYKRFGPNKTWQFLDGICIALKWG